MAAVNSRSIPRYLLQALSVIDPWWAYKQQYERVPGISVGISFHNQIIFTAGYGFSDVKAKKKMTSETQFRIASISKVFTATAIMQLVEYKKLRLDEPVVSYLPWFSSHKKAASLENVAIRHLLTHRAGITRDGATQQWTNDIFPTLEQIKEEVRQGITVFAPLQKFKYSNFGYTILGQVIEAVSGQEYGRYIETNICKPLGLFATYSDYEPKSSKNLAKGYGREVLGSSLRGEITHMSTAAMAPATGFVSNIADLCKFMAAQRIGSGRLLSDQSKREMQLGLSLESDDEKQYGLGLQVVKADGRRILTHSGGFAGFTTRVALDGEEDISVAILTNATGTDIDILTYGIFRIISYFRGNQAFIRSRSRKKEYQDFQGLYRGRWDDIQIVSLGDRLFGFLPSLDNPMLGDYVLEDLGHDRFRIAACDGYDYVGESVQFQRDSKGKIKGMLFGPYPLTRATEASNLT